MILTCPECGTRYVVKDGAIPPEGRQVRCASCKHSWHQEPQASDPTDETPDVAHSEIGIAEEFPAPAPMTHPAGEPGGKPPEAALADHGHPDMAAEEVPEVEDPDSHPLPEQGAAEAVPETADYRAEPMPEPVEEPVVTPEQGDWADETPTVAQERDADDFAAYAPYEEERPRRRGLLLLLIAVLLIAGIAAAFWFVAPAQWQQRLGLSENGETPLLVQVDERNRRTLESGNQLLEVSGKVINPTDQPQRVPPLQAQLRSLEQAVVYRWTIPPPAPTIAPGGSATFNSAELNIPASAACLDVSFGESPAVKVKEPCRAVEPGASTQAS